MLASDNEFLIPLILICGVLPVTIAWTSVIFYRRLSGWHEAVANLSGIFSLPLLVMGAASIYSTLSQAASIGFLASLSKWDKTDYVITLGSIWTFLSGLAAVFMLSRLRSIKRNKWRAVNNRPASSQPTPV